MLWGVSCPALVSSGLPWLALVSCWYPLAILLVSFGMLWGVSCPALADSGVSHALPWYPLAILLVSSGILLVSSGWLWYVSVLSSGCALACLGWLWVCSGMSHCWLCPDDVLCKNRPCPNFTLWILSIHVNLELIYEFIYTCQ